MKSTRKYKVGLVLSFVMMVIPYILPENANNAFALLFYIGALIFLICLVALIVSKIKARKRTPKVSEPTETAKPVEPMPEPAPIRPVEPTPATHAPASPFSPSPASQTAPPSPVAAPAKKATNIERIHVRGVDHYTKNVVAVATENEDYTLTKRELIEDHLDERVYQYDFFVKAALVPDPDNEHDPNAIMVQADGLCIGHVPKGSTAHIRKLMESDRIKYMDLKIGGGKYKEVYETDDDEYELDIGELNYSAVLELHLTDD